ncbi:MAG: hypothetical protein Q7R81_07395 [Candidatus Peregrinibacteria bacterium]|nr:hypothetical protein [Candidatus Peregrinibacteria bacterium]
MRHNRTHRFTFPLWAPLCIVPFVVLLFAIIHFGVPVVVGDFWGTIPFMEEVLLRHEFQPSFLLSQFNEHRFPLPLLLITGMALLTGWNIYAELLIAPMAAAASVALLCTLFSRTLPDRHWSERAGMCVFTSWLLFSLTGRHVWLMSIHLTAWVSIACFLGAVLLATGRPLTFSRFLGVIALCVASSFSFGFGLLSWIAILPLMVVQPVPPLRGSPLQMHRRIVWVALYLAAWSATVFVYFHGYSSPPSHPSPVFGLQHPVLLVQFISTLGGAPLFPQSPILASTLGALTALGTMGLLAHALRQRRMPPSALPWVSIALFSLLSCILIGIARVGFGSYVALSPRYFSVASLWLVAVLSLSILLTTFPRIPVLLALGIMESLVIVHSMREWTPWEQLSANFRRGMACLQSYEISSDACLRELSAGEPESVRAFAPALERMGMVQMFSLPADVSYVLAPDEQLGAWEHTENLDTGTGDSSSIVMGWAVLPSCRKAEHVVLTYGHDHTLLAHTTAILSRKDIAAERGTCFRKSGWTVEISRDAFERARQIGLVEAWVYDEQLHQVFLLTNEEQFNS